MGVRAELIKQAYEAFGRGDIPIVLENLTEDVEWSAPRTLPQGGQFHGKAGALEFFQGMGTAWETLALDVEGIGEVGEDLVVGIVSGAGTLRGGGASGYGAVHVFTVRAGKIARFREYADLDGPLGQPVRFHSFGYDELPPTNLPAPEIIACEIVEDLTAGLAEVEAVAAALETDVGP